MSVATLQFPSRSNAFSAVKSASSRRDSVQPGVDRNGVKRIKLSFPTRQVKPTFDQAQAIQTLIKSFEPILASRPLLPNQTLDSLYTLCQTILSNLKYPASSSSANQPTPEDAKEIYEAATEALRNSAQAVGKEFRSLILSSSPSTKGISFLNLVLDKWNSWEKNSIKLISVLLHLDRGFVLNPNSGLKGLRDVALEAFEEGGLGEKIVRERYLESIAGWVKGERERLDDIADNESELSNPSNTTLVQNFINLLKTLSSLQPLTSSYLTQVQSYYSQVSLIKFPTSSGSDNKGYRTFVDWVNEKLEQEEERYISLFGAGEKGEKEVRDVLQKELVHSLVLDVVKPALDEAMNTSDAGSLKRLYTLLTDIKEFTAFRKALSQHVKDKATSLISDPTKDATMISSLLAFKEFCETAVDGLYEGIKGDRVVEETTPREYKEIRRRLALEMEIRDGLKEGVETRQATPAELIAKHLDQTMRKGQGSMSAEGFEKALNNIVDLVKFTKDKDVFKEFYITQLAKRLLLGRSASMEEEISMVKKLQNEYGEEFTTGDAMMKDLTQSEEMNKKYQELRMSTGKDATNLSVNVLSQGQWPPYKPLGKGWEQLTLVPSMQKELEGFEAWYKHTFSGRTLSWRHQHTSVTLTAKFPGGNKEIGVSLFQALVLLQFNDVETLDFEEIRARTGIERDELVRTLQSLYALKVTRVLLKRPPGKEVNPTDTFTWNSGFTRDRIRFKINQLQQELSAEESKQTSEKVFEDRNLTLDAQIVRIMKGKKQIRLQDLINEVIEAVKKLFHPEVKAIKAQVDSLIEREYLERDDSDRNVLRYLA